MKSTKHMGLDRLGKDPSFDWYFCLTCFAIAVVLVGLADLAIYFNLSSESNAPVLSTIKSQNHIDRKEIESLAGKLRSEANAAVGVSSAALRDPALHL